MSELFDIDNNPIVSPVTSEIKRLWDMAKQYDIKILWIQEPGETSRKRREEEEARCQQSGKGL